MIEIVALILAGLAVVVIAHEVARHTGLPPSVLLVLAGVGYGFLPGPNLALNPDLVLVVVIPPLLYAAALQSSVIALRGSARAIAGLSVGLVFITALALGIGLSATSGAIPLAAGIALGAAVAPPDPVAALSIGRAGLPPRLITLVEGEGLLNDATALTILQVAVAASVSGAFSPYAALARLLGAAAGGLAVGVVVAILIGRVHASLRDALVNSALSLGTPFAAYILAEELHVSGVLAVVVAGLWLGHRSPTHHTSESRLQIRAVWRLVEFLLEGYVFLLIGQQLPDILRSLTHYAPGEVAVASAMSVGVPVVLRPLSIVLATRLSPRRRHRSGPPPLSGKEILALSWSGTRGVITLAAAFSLPSDFPARGLLLFCAYLVVLVTLVGQGLTFAPMLRRLHLPGADVSDALVRNQARAAAARAALARLDELQDESSERADQIRPLRQVMQTRLQRYSDRVELLSAVEDEALPTDERYTTGVLVRREMLAAQREELLSWRDSGRLPDAGLRTLQRELDYEESLLPQRPA